MEKCPEVHCFDNCNLLQRNLLQHFLEHSHDNIFNRNDWVRLGFHRAACEHNLEHGAASHQNQLVGPNGVLKYAKSKAYFNHRAHTE